MENFRYVRNSNRMAAIGKILFSCKSNFVNLYFHSGFFNIGKFAREKRFYIRMYTCCTHLVAPCPRVNVERLDHTAI